MLKLIQMSLNFIFFPPFLLFALHFQLRICSITGMQTNNEFWKFFQPAVYVAESAISSGSAGSSSDGSGNIAAISAGIGLASVAAASLVLLQVGKNSPPPVQTVEYTGPSLTYYINKFKPQDQIIQASAPPSEAAPSTSVQLESPALDSLFQIDSQF